jgi:hypothetical protein
MLKSYRGYALPSSNLVAYALEYRCPRCGSEDVAIDVSAPVPEFCDGSPSTADELTSWECVGCNNRAAGHDFVVR